jgi:hypothetical protein
MDSERRNFASAPLNSKSALRGNEALRKRHEALQEELAAHGYCANEEQKERINKGIIEDSDDMNEEYTSSVWGDGTTKVLSHHYKTLQSREMQKVKKDGKPEALTATQFVDIGTKLAATRKEKAIAKKNGLQEAEQRARLESINHAELSEIQKMRDLLASLEAQVATELERLQAAEERKRRDIEFVEQAFYTSNEEAMGVTPANFDE